LAGSDIQVEEQWIAARKIVRDLWLASHPGPPRIPIAAEEQECAISEE
jgi:hypothetical protein